MKTNLKAMRLVCIFAAFVLLAAGLFPGCSIINKLSEEYEAVDRTPAPNSGYLPTPDPHAEHPDDPSSSDHPGASQGPLPSGLPYTTEIPGQTHQPDPTGLPGNTDLPYTTEIPGATPIPTPSGGQTGDYIFPYSDTRYLSMRDLWAVDPELWSFGRNEIFARHGDIFDTPKYNEYFSGRSWYVPDPNYSSNSLSSLEWANVRFIRSWENADQKAYYAEAYAGSSSGRLGFLWNVDGIDGDPVGTMAEFAAAIGGMHASNNAQYPTAYFEGNSMSFGVSVNASSTPCLMCRNTGNEDVIVGPFRIGAPRNEALTRCEAEGWSFLENTGTTLRVRAFGNNYYTVKFGSSGKITEVLYEVYY